MSRLPILTLTLLTSLTNCESENDSCPLWHVPGRNGQCECGANLNGVVTCDEHFVYIAQGNCMTWNNSTHGAEVHLCLLSPLKSNSTCTSYSFPNAYRIIPINTTARWLNHLTCKDYNRQGTQCKYCLDGYGPAIFSDGITCADCSRHKYFWMLNLMFQLTMLTAMYIAFIPLQFKGTSSPLNIIITYIQLGVIGVRLGARLKYRIECHFGKTFTIIIMTIFSVWNLDFFHEVLPSSCVSSSLKAVNMLFFDYIVAIYPYFLTVCIFLSIKLYDRNYRLLVFLSSPVRKCFKVFHTTWDPKKTILNTFTTFFLLSYSKILFGSINFLLAIQSYNSLGKTIPNSTVLLYDPTIRFFHSEHIPYAILAVTIILVFVLSPPILLLLYQTYIFSACLTMCRFQRWDILHLVMDIFQGWYKDGTDGTRDYRYFSALYLLLRIGLGCEFVVMIVRDYKDDRLLWEWTALGILHVLLGTSMFVLKPYKKVWMSHADGLIFTVIGVLLLMEIYNKKVIYIIGLSIGFLIMILIGLIVTYYKCTKK